MQTITLGYCGRDHQILQYPFCFFFLFRNRPPLYPKFQLGIELHGQRPVFFFFLASLAAWGDLTNFGHLAGSGSDVCKFQVTFLERKLCTLYFLFLLTMAGAQIWCWDVTMQMKIMLKEWNTGQKSLYPLVLSPNTRSSWISLVKSLLLGFC